VSLNTLSVSGTSKTALWAGRIMSGIVILFLVMDVAMKLADLPIVTQTGLQLGWHAGTGRVLGVILLVCLVLYVVPRTAVLGAILLTGYFGGTVATHLRVDDPLLTHTLFGVYLGLLAWGGLWLRDPRLQALIPLRTS
jgi:hypothetical protein